MSGNGTGALKLLVIDDDSEVVKTVRSVLDEQDVEVYAADDVAEGFQLFLDLRPRVVVTERHGGRNDGIDLLKKILTVDPAVDVILVTSDYSTEGAVQAIQSGARDYLTKPLDAERLRRLINVLMSEAEERHRVIELEQSLVGACQMEGIIGRSTVMLQLFAKVRRVAPHFRTVLITGATGTGKELVARALHRLSPVSSRPLAVCNCSALVETLLESELFGHVRGAFTGAVQDKLGVFEYANGGTVFLDEIGELPLSAQVKLLRVLQNQEVQRVGSPVTRHVDVRVVAATHRNLRSLVAEGRFREDLFYRLSMVEIEVPRLADRKEDLPLLQRHFVARFAAQYNKGIGGITRRAQAVLGRYSWPGNVRELENVIGNASMMTVANVIDVPDLPEQVRNQTQETRGETRLISLEELQRQHLVHVLEAVGGNKVRASEILGVSRATVYDMLAKLRKGEEAKKKAAPAADAAGSGR